MNNSNQSPVLKDYPHLYLGCECYLPRFDRTSKLIMVSLEGGGFFRITSPDFDVWQSNFKPILRPLSDILDRDFHNIADELAIVTDSVYNWLQEALIHGCGRFSTDVKLINALRKRGYDCDGLIPAGLAIDSTTLKATTNEQ